MEASVAATREVKVGTGPGHQETVDQVVFALGSRSDEDICQVWGGQTQVGPALGQCPHNVHVAGPHSSQQGSLIVEISDVDTGSAPQQPLHNARLARHGGRVESSPAA